MLFAFQGDATGVLWKFQMMLGGMVMVAGLLIAVYPQILVAAVAAITMLVGASLIASGWRLRRFSQSAGRHGPYGEVIDV